MAVYSDVDIFKENPNIQLLPVIASFDAKGHIRPLYMNYQGLRLKIDNIKCVNKVTSNQIEFICETTLSDYVKTVYLMYHTDYRVWSLNLRRL